MDIRVTNLFYFANVIVIICTSVISIAIIFDFIIYHSPGSGKVIRKSRISTLTMVAFFILYLFLLRTKIGRVTFYQQWLNYISVISGLILITSGCLVNILGRIKLQGKWSDQIVIYEDHIHVKNGVYRYIRHPLYASLIWMFAGGSLIYLDYLSLIAVFCIFIPMVYIRARQEESVLGSEFEEYRYYKMQTGMFFPKMHKSRAAKSLLNDKNKQIKSW